MAEDEINEEESNDVFGPPNPDGFKKLTPEESERWDKAFFRASKTQGRTKLVRYFEELLKNEDFQNTIRELRKKYGYPEGGYKDDVKYDLGNWSERKEMLRKLDHEIDKLCKKYGLHFVHWGDILRTVVSSDTFDIAEPGPDLCMIADLRNEAEEPFMKEIQDADNLLFPIAIRVSPFATQRDIIDFVKKHEAFISQMQEHYRKDLKGIRIGKTKKRKAEIQERNDFIYQNRNLPRRKIMELLTEKYGAKKTLDMGHISKIISLEKQRRKEA